MHCVALVYPDPWPYVPATHEMQVDTLEAPTADDVVPAMQATHVLANDAPTVAE